MADPRITAVGTVFVPVADADASLAFYGEALGFEKRSDFAYGDGDRWVEVAPPGGGVALALVATEGHPGGRDRTLCAMATDDVEAAHAALVERGVEVEPIGREGSGRAGLFLTEVTIENPVPPQFFFRDPDGNRFLVVEPG
jgi:catechol 2,3-dioxygenase-like lactoylglutathione lyase family enzyme